MDRKNILNNREEFSLNRSVYKAMGYSDEDLQRPVIGIANAWSTLVPGHFNLRQVSDYVKQGIYRGGGTAVEFGTIGCCDALGQGHEGMHYILPSRELIAGSIEVMAQAHNLAGLVLLGSCDKIVPGMLMAAARLDIPCIHLPGGPMLGGEVTFHGRKSDMTAIDEGLGALRAGKISRETFEKLEEGYCSSCGSCSFYGTANTMCTLSEALGMALSGGAMTPAVHPDRLRLAQKTGEAICNLVINEITARNIITRDAVENAVRICLATSGSTNAVMHLSAIAYEAELDMNVLETFEAYNKETPVIARVYPACNADMNDLFLAGGVPRIQQNLLPLLHGQAMTVTGRPLSENLNAYVYRYEKNPDCITTLDAPFEKQGGLQIMRGNLAPMTAVTKPGAIDPSARRFTGTALCFDCEEDANRAILSGFIKEGTVIVIRYEGPKGGPGMREMYKSMKYLNGMGLAKTAALITDGRFSGTNNGCFVGHISPEAASGGPLAIVQDGDIIEIDCISGKLELKVSEEEIKQRLKTWVPKKPKFKKGYLSTYARMVSSAAEGAIIG
ncbi:dihydroxy-acid dehydratase [Ihubacter massiliensis]|uniref:Dihydroxy-acid dehydratase n=1 Tax=Hominibacterium faecale TaxID=2839743 RepID=A0A9J6QQ72_9FIRM|nr:MULTISPECIES: dihydroxy-acid dehydratase [Eubacteriales Family XIII. Incertae Sedis]MCO7121097.1 dihydroxy-acid dehydratase [Ihubacter massiliensis]MCU7378013.1 dihydroxy-acid dehydratase [Hominibacterium faecale]